MSNRTSSFRTRTGIRLFSISAAVHITVSTMRRRAETRAPAHVAWSPFWAHAMRCQHRQPCDPANRISHAGCAAPSLRKVAFKRKADMIGELGCFVAPHLPGAWLSPCLFPAALASSLVQNRASWMIMNKELCFIPCGMHVMRTPKFWRTILLRSRHDNLARTRVAERSSAQKSVRLNYYCFGFAGPLRLSDFYNVKLRYREIND